MSDEKGRGTKGGVTVGKVIKWILLGILIIVVAVIGYSVYTCTAVTSAVVGAVVDVAEVVGTGNTGGRGSSAATTPISIVVDDAKDIPFLHNDPRIEVGRTYEVTVDAWVSQAAGTNLILATDSSGLGLDSMMIKLTSRIEDFPRGTPVRAVFLYKPGSILKDVSVATAELVSIERR